MTFIARKIVGTPVLRPSIFFIYTNDNIASTQLSILFAEHVTIKKN